MGLVLEIPDSVQEALRLPAGQQTAELLKELAVALYSRSALSFSKACEPSKIDRLEFGRPLARREVPRGITARKSWRGTGNMILP